MAETKSQTVCFTVTGADITRIARERLLEDNPAHAWRIAMCLRSDDETLNATVDGIAVKLLKGEVRLGGDSTKGMTVVPEAAGARAAHEAAVRYLYAGRVKVNGLWYRPVARVTDVGRNDLKNNHGKLVRAIDRGGMTNRAWHYCGPKEIILHELSNVIFEPCGELPFWMLPAKDEHAAIGQWSGACRNLEERGHSVWYPTPPAAPPPANAEVVLQAAVEAFDRLDVDDLDEDDVDAREELTRLDRIELEAEDARLEAERQAKLAAWRTAIFAQAGGNLMELSWPAKGEHPAATVQIPRAPFARWAINRWSRLRYLAPPWNNVCPSGLKLPMDDENHSDWLVAAGIDPWCGVYAHPSYDAAIAKMSEVIEEMTGRANAGIVTLVEGRTATSLVVHGKRNTRSSPGAIVVVPNLNPAYLAAITDARAVITEAGGAMAHLANVSREQSVPMILVPDALKRFAVGDRVTVDTKAGTVAFADAIDDIAFDGAE